jgi:hypothetical protein
LLEEAFLCNPQESDLGIANQSCRMASVMRRPGRASGKGSSGAPVLDRTMFCVLWGGKTCRLGNTLSFKLLERLAQPREDIITFAHVDPVFPWAIWIWTHEAVYARAFRLVPLREIG